MSGELNYSFPQLLKALVEQGGSDLHLSVGSPPRLRISGDLLKLEASPLTPRQTQQLCYSILTEEQKRMFEQEHELDFSFKIKDLARFRANIYMQQDSIAGVFRVIPLDVTKIENLGLPKAVSKLCDQPRGLILVTGPTGSGKSTTLAAMIDKINEDRKGHIVTIEDPIEFVHQHKNCMINQREVGSDTKSFARALKSALRQDPDVVMLGELRDLESVALAMTTAETGHLVLGTLHTNSAISSLTRIIDIFPAHQQDQIRTQLSFSLIGVLSQALLPNRQGGRAMAMEVMIPNVAIRNLIRENKTQAIYSAMQSGQGDSGMITFNQSLLTLVRNHKIAAETAMTATSDRDELIEMFYKNHIKFSRTTKTA